MKDIKLLCIGESKYLELKDLEQKYIKRINSFIKFTVTKIKEAKLENEELIKKKEAEVIIKYLMKGDFVVGLDERGQKMDSLEFARFLSDKISYYSGRIVFLIGGFTGLSRLLNKRLDLKLSFSDMTFSHDIFRLVFLEQLYRAFTIIKGITYHR